VVAAGGWQFPNFQKNLPKVLDFQTGFSALENMTCIETQKIEKINKNMIPFQFLDHTF
jgi:hypothetical protein